jgi:hypothetical protein
VAEPANPDNPNPLTLQIPSVASILVERGGHSETTAHKWTNVFLPVPFRYLEEETRIGAKIGGKPAVMHMLTSLVDSVFKVGELPFGAEVVKPVPAKLALTAGLRERAETNDISDVEVLYSGTYPNDAPDHFMAGDERVA